MTRTREDGKEEVFSACIKHDKNRQYENEDLVDYSIHRLNHFPINFKITKYDWRIYTKNRKENIKPQI